MSQRKDWPLDVVVHITPSFKKRMETQKLSTRKFRSNLLNYAYILKTGARKRERAEMERKAIDQLEAQGVSMQPAPYSYPYDYQVHAANKRHAPPPGSAVDEYPDTSHQVIEPILCPTLGCLAFPPEPQTQNTKQSA